MLNATSLTLTVNHFGARGLGGATDDTVFIQAAITYKGTIGYAGGGVLNFLPGTYNITQPLIANSGVMLRAQQANDISTNTNGSGNGEVIIRWLGATAPASAMYTIQPLVTGTVIWGGGSDGIYWDGNSNIIVAVFFNNTKYAMFDGNIRSVTYCGLLISSAAGSTTNFSQQNEVRRLEFIYGSSSACDNANACILAGNGSTVPGTQQKIRLIAGLVKNGYGLVINETDNCLVDFVTIATIGTGGAVLLSNAGFGPSNSNKFRKISGKVNQAPGLYGNNFLQVGSEGGGFVGSGTWDGEIEDYVTGRNFKSHVYQMRKWINIGAGDFNGDSGTVIGDLALQWGTVQLPKATVGRVTALIPTDYDLANGNFVGLEFNYSTNSNTGGNIRMRFKISFPSVSGTSNVVVPDFDFTVTLPQSSQYVNTRYSLVLSPVVPYLKGSALFISAQRLPSDPLDTATGEVCVLGMRLNYASLGPDSAGSGTYFVPAWD